MKFTIFFYLQIVEYGKNQYTHQKLALKCFSAFYGLKSNLMNKFA